MTDICSMNARTIQLYLSMYICTAVSCMHDHACMKLLLHGMRMLSARACMVACMVAAGSIRTSTDTKNVPTCVRWRCASTIF